MTDKHIIKLKPKEDLNEKIIKEKGNTKCIFYADDICRNGDKTVDNKHNVNYTVRLVDYDREKTLKTFYELEEAKKHFEVV